MEPPGETDAASHSHVAVGERTIPHWSIPDSTLRPVACLVRDHPSMILVALQPGYLPWLGYFEQLWRSDVFVHLDTVQYDRHGWRNRNRIRTPGEPGWSWLTVPVRTKGTFGAPIYAMMIDERTNWRQKHWRAIEHHYGSAPYFEAYAAPLKDIYERPWSRLVDLDVALVDTLADMLGLEAKRRVRASALGGADEDGPNERLVSLCQEFGADRYYSGAAARDYLDEALFRESGIEIVFQHYPHPAYRQRYPGFVSHLSIIDLIFNAGPESLTSLLVPSTEPTAAPGAGPGQRVSQDPPPQALAPRYNASSKRRERSKPTTVD